MLTIFGTVLVTVVTFLIMFVTSLIQYPFKFGTRYLLNCVLNFLKNKRIEVEQDYNTDENCVQILEVVDGDINAVTKLIKYFK